MNTYSESKEPKLRFYLLFVWKKATPIGDGSIYADIVAQNLNFI